MAAPSQTLPTQRPDLASLFQFDLQASWGGFIGYSLFPVQPVGRQAGNFGVLKLNQLLQTRPTERAPGSGYNRQTHEFDYKKYACTEHGQEEPVDDSEEAMYADYYSQVSVATARCYDAILRNAETRVQSAIYGISNSNAATATWSTYATATPIDDVQAAMLAVRNRVGFVPNVLQVEYETFQHLKNCDQIVDRVKYQGYMDARPGDISAQAIATALNIDRVVVAGASSMANSADQAASSASLSTIWPTTTAAVMVVARTNDVREPCLGRTFHWGGTGAFNDGSTIGGTLEIYRDEPVRSDIVRARHQVDEVLIYEECGQLITGVGA